MVPRWADAVTASLANPKRPPDDADNAISDDVIVPVDNADDVRIEKYL